jgi:ubiquinone/menaquinone biosynthesis C-methylase UbiE
MGGNRSKNRWEELAREDAEFYIWTDLAPGDDFFRSGERDVARILEFAKPHLQAQGSALEIGCGVGRLTLPMSRQFGSVTAVDIAPTMLEKLRANCRQRQIVNVQGMLAGESWDATRHDLAYTRIVLQHVESWPEILSYFKRVSRALAPNGAFYTQFDTRPSNPLYWVRNRLPDQLLPRTYRKGVRRIRRLPDQVVDAARQGGLELIVERGRHTEDHEFLFRPARA